jgi:hypothetical protein
MMEGCVILAREEITGICGKKRDIYVSSFDSFVQYVRYDKYDLYTIYCWLMNTKPPRLYHAQPLGAASMKSLETRYSTWGHACSLCQALFFNHIPLLLHRLHVSQSKLSNSEGFFFFVLIILYSLYL